MKSNDFILKNKSHLFVAHHLKIGNHFSAVGMPSSWDNHSMASPSHRVLLAVVERLGKLFTMLPVQIWRSTALSGRNKIQIFNNNVKSVLLYGSKMRRVTKTSTQKLQTFTNRCLRNILNIRWPEVVSNEELWNKEKPTPMEMEIKKHKWGWIGQTLRKPVSNITRQALEWNPQGKGKVGRPKQTWRQSTDDEIKAAGTTWAELKRTSQNRVW